MQSIFNHTILFVLLFYLGNLIEASFGQMINMESKPESYLRFQKSYDNSVFEDISQKLKKEIRIFCVILTAPRYKHTKCIPQKETWLKNCNDYIFASTANDPTLPAIKFFHREGYQFSYGKIKNALKWVYKKYKDKYDYILKADDDAYYVMDNLRAFLINKNPNDDGFYGFRVYNPPGDERNAYIQGGSGFVFSKKTFNTLVENGLDNRQYCSQKANVYDDMEIGRCLVRMGIQPMHVVDDKNRFVFNPQQVSSLISDEKGTRNYYRTFASIEIKRGFSFIGDFPIAFHYVDGNSMYLLEYLIYHAQVMGSNSRLFRMKDSDFKNHDKKVEERLELIKLFSNYNYKTL